MILLLICKVQFAFFKLENVVKLFRYSFYLKIIIIVIIIIFIIIVVIIIIIITNIMINKLAELAQTQRHFRFRTLVHLLSKNTTQHLGPSRATGE